MLGSSRRTAHFDRAPFDQRSENTFCQMGGDDLRCNNLFLAKVLEAQFKRFINFAPQRSLQLALSRPLNLQFDKLHIERLKRKVQARHCHRQMKPAWAGASWIDVEHTIAFEFSRLMRMPADDHMETGGGRI